MAGLDKKIWIIANWKSNKTISEALGWVSKVGPNIPRDENLKVVVCPTFSSLAQIKKEVIKNNYPILLGCQDLSPFEIGAYTGEEAAGLIKDLVDLAIIGHSERRDNFSETDELVSKKVEQANMHKIIPLVCIQDKKTPIPQSCKLIAYEPTWAIGSGTADTPENASDVAQSVKSEYGEEVEVLYGGSVNSQNIKGFISQKNLNGVLVGNASLDPEEFVKILKSI